MADPLRRAADPTPPLVIQAVNLHKVYSRGRERVEALRGVNLEVARGAFVVVRGPSGSGKSTLLHLLGGIDRPTSGSVLVDGTSLETAGERELTRFRRDHVGFIFQFYNLLPSIPTLDNVILPLLAQGWPYAKARRRGAEMLAQVGLENRRDHLPAELSGGEQQRVAIARALIVEPVVVLADEPTGDLDSESAHGVMDLMSELNRRSGTTFVVATHNPELAARADRTLDLRDGRLQPGRGET
jgi:ABC-type lipoprotein export system ATPase subunit